MKRTSLKRHSKNVPFAGHAPLRFRLLILIPYPTGMSIQFLNIHLKRIRPTNPISSQHIFINKL
ncbi:MAG: hypothetical protein WCO44_02860, partial [Bacteroidota bacterium]